MSPILPAALTPSRVLLVARDAELVRQVQRELRRLGCETVEVAADALEARKRCLRLLPHVVLIDLQLPSTLQAFAIAAAIAPQLDAPIIYLNHAKGDLPPAEVFVHGFGVVDKPITRRGLSTTIGFALSRHDAEATLRERVAGMDLADLPAGHDSQPAPSAATGGLTPEFLGSMAHELRAPLQGVVGFAAFLREGKAGAISEAQQQYLEHIATGAGHVLQVVNDVLDLTAAESACLQVRTEAVDPEQATREVLQVLQVIAIRRRIELQVHVDEQLGHVVSDATKIKQVLYNFVSNALKFTPAGGRVMVSLRRDGQDQFCLEVADTGFGIPAATLAGVFRAERRGRRRSRGLGLLLTKRIVDALGGSVSASNRPEGGSVFSARLPIAPSVATRHDVDLLLASDA